MAELKDYLVIDAVNSIYNSKTIGEYVHMNNNDNHYTWSKTLEGGCLGLFHQELIINTMDRRFEIHFDVTRERINKGEITIETLVNAHHVFDDVSSMEKTLGETATSRILEMTEYH